MDHNSQRCACTSRPMRPQNTQPFDTSCGEWWMGTLSSGDCPTCRNTSCRGNQMSMNWDQSNREMPPASTSSCQRTDGTMDSSMDSTMNFQMNSKMDSKMDSFGKCGMMPGMTYVPWQNWGRTYPLSQALTRGTIFPDLDYPFEMGRCR